MGESLTTEPTTYDAYRRSHITQWKEPVKTPPNTHDVVQAALVVPWRDPAKGTRKEGLTHESGQRTRRGP